MAEQEFAGIAAIVTGGASGIGLATAQLLAARGADVCCLDLVEAGLPAPLTPVHCDVTDDTAVRDAVATAVLRLGHLDVLVNNAGIGAQGTVEDNDDAEWRRVFEVNVFGMARVARAAVPHLRQSAHGAIVNTSSVAAGTGLPDRVLYSASKGAVYSMTLAMAADLIRDGIRVNCVCPGTTETPWVQRLLDRAPDPAAERVALDARQPHGRLVSAAEVANAIAFLASPANGSTAGIGLVIDGGSQNLRLRPRPAS